MPEKEMREVEMSFSSVEEFEEEWKKNISKGGIFLKIDPPPAVREQLKVVLNIIAVRRKLALSGEAVHITSAGVGIHLDPLPKETASAIESILAKDEETEPEIALELTPEPEPKPEPAPPPTPAGEEKDTPPEGTDPSLYRRIGNMTRAEKAAAARKGQMDTRNILIRDRDPFIVMSVLQNPGITIAEIIQITKSQGLTLDMIKHVSRQNDWMAIEDVRFNIVLNPKSPQPLVLSLLPKLSERNLRMLAKRPIKQAIKSAALKIILERQGVRK